MGGEHAIENTDVKLKCCTSEKYVLLTNVTPIPLI